MKTPLVTPLERNATTILAELARAWTPVLISQQGVPAAYLLDGESFETLQDRMRLLGGSARGETAIQEGRTVTHRETPRIIKRWKG